MYKGSTTNKDKAKPAERRERKGTGPRFLRDGAYDATKDSKTAGLPNIGLHWEVIQLKRIFTALRLTASLTLTGAALLGFALQAQATPTLYVAEGRFGATSGNLYIMDPTTGLKTQTIGPIGFRVTGMAFDPTTGLLYGSTGNLSPNIPASISLVTSTSAS